MIPEKGPIDVKMGVEKNCVSISDGSLTHCGGPHNFFWKEY